MQYLGDYPDNVYPLKGLNHLRRTARGLLLNEEGKIAFTIISRDDQFGKLTYLELPGGGIEEKEEIETALKRELEEELGVLIEIIVPIGMVSSSYNLIKERNENYYFLCQKIGIGNRKIVSSGDTLIKEIIYLDLDEAIVKLNKQAKQGNLNEVVALRELPILSKTKQLNLIEK